MMSPIFNESCAALHADREESAGGGGGGVRTRWPRLFLEDPSDRRIIRLRPKGRGRKILIIAGRKISPANPLGRLIARRGTKRIGLPVAFSHFSFYQLSPSLCPPCYRRRTVSSPFAGIFVEICGTRSVIYLGENRYEINREFING